MRLMTQERTTRCYECGKRYTWNRLLQLDLEEEYKGKTLWAITVRCGCGEVLKAKRVISCRNCKFMQERCRNPKKQKNIFDCWTEVEEL